MMITKKPILNSADIELLRETLTTKDDLKNFVTKDDLKLLVTKQDTKNFATKDDLKDFATKDDLKLVATKKGVNKVSKKLDELFNFLDRDISYFKRKVAYRLRIDVSELSAPKT